MLSTILALGTAGAFVLWRVLPALENRDEYRVAVTDFQLTPRPPWIRSDLTRQMLESGLLAPTVSLLEEDLAARLAEAFGLHPWVREVRGVRISADRRIHVDLRYRRPVALVEVRGGTYPVDEQATLLPTADFSAADAEDYLHIRRVASLPQGPAGTPWGEVDVLGAARLAAFLHTPQHTWWKELGLVAIVLPERRKADVKLEELVYQLATRGGSRIIWGRAPGVDHPSEPTADQKLARLRTYHADFGGFDQPNGPYEIDIRHWREITRRPLVPNR